MFSHVKHGRIAQRWRHSYNAGMVTISITAEAFNAVKATLSADAEADTRPDGKGGFHITLPRDVLNKLRLIRKAGESYSDVIMRIANQ